MLSNNYQYKTPFSIAGNLKAIGIWLLIVIFTLGLGIFSLHYIWYIIRMNRTIALDEWGEKVGNVFFDMSMENVGALVFFTVLWSIGIVASFGVLYFGLAFTAKNTIKKRCYLKRAMIKRGKK